MIFGRKSPIRVLVLTASLRRDSLNGRLAALGAEVFRRNEAEIDHGRIGDFDSPSYDADVEAESGVPGPVTNFCRRLMAADAFVIVSPEYNASMPGSLKNLIDWTSRLRPQPFNGKQCFLMSASPSMAGGNRGLWSLRVPLEHLGTRVYPDMFSLAQAHEAFSTDGRLANDMLQQRLAETIRCFLELVEAAKHYPAIRKEWVEFLGEKPNYATDRVEVSEINAA
ncbi:MAG TPA: NAD(P)H-dependent oxidoreductase [Gemmatimonadaceae bacterium]